MPTPPTILLQPFATQWLGHVSRLIAIAQAIRRMRPEVRLLFALDGNAGPLLETVGFPYITLPRRADASQPEWNAWHQDQREKIFGACCKSLLEQLQPRVVVFDCVPYSHLAKQVRQMKIRAAFVARRTRREERSFEIVQAHSSMLDLVIVPHTPDEIPIPHDLADKAHYVGTIVRDASPAAQMQSPETDSKLIVITGGGGGFDGTVDYYNLAMAAVHDAATQSPGFRAVLVTGPMFREWDRLKPVEGVTIMPFDPDFTATLARADAVICQAGYNTMAELARLAIPTICVPAPRVADDQYARAERIAARRPRFFVAADPSREVLAQHILQCLAMPHLPAPPVSPDLRGADRAAELILALSDRS